MPIQIDSPMSRRDFLSMGAGLLLSTAIPVKADSNRGDFWERPRSLWLYNQNTKDNIRACYWRGGAIDVEGYVSLCKVLRDHRQHVAVQMDIALLDLLRGVTGFYEQNGFDLPIVVHSGFRTTATNELLRKRGESPARNSMHLYGKAIDFSMPRVSPADLARLGMYFKRGGVGYYPEKNFIHLDTGRIRAWRG